MGQVTSQVRNNITKGFFKFGKSLVGKFKIWFEKKTVVDIYIARIKICAINQFRKGEAK